MSESESQSARADLGRYQLAYRSCGSGSPTVVLEAGGGCAHDAWSAVFDAIAQFARVISYDRLGLGASDPGIRCRTCLDLVRDLHDLVRLSTRSSHVMAKHSGHFIQSDQPELVVTAIRQIVELARIKPSEPAHETASRSVGCSGSPYSDLSC